MHSSALCESYVNSCTVEMSKSLSDGHKFKLSPNAGGQSKLHFAIPVSFYLVVVCNCLCLSLSINWIQLQSVDAASINEFAIEASILYGNVVMYAAFDRKPKISGDHDFTNANTAEQDTLNIVSIRDIIDIIHVL
mgnify:CR=1 FL=1